MPSFECKNKDNSSYRSKLSKCIENHRHSVLFSKQVCHKSRDREPSRISLRKVIKLLKCRTLRKGRKNTLIRGIPVSSVLHSVATNYKLWRLKYISSNDSFYSCFFKPGYKISVRYNARKQTLLMSGVIELNPGPFTDQ